MKENNICDLPKEILYDFLDFTHDGAFLVIKVRAKSNTDKLTLDENGELILKTKKLAIENEANTSVCEIIAQIFNLPKSHVTIKSGHTSRLKRLFLNNIKNYVKN